MKHFTFILQVTLAAALSFNTVAAENTREQSLDLSKHIYKLENTNAAFSGPRWVQLNAIDALMEAGKADRFSRDTTPQRAKQDKDGNYIPTISHEAQNLTGEMLGPGGDLWFYNAVISYEPLYYNEYYTEYLPVSIDIEILDGNMKVVGTIKDKLRLKENERRVRLVDVLPMISQNYFNSDDKYEVAITLLNNPSDHYGIIPHTYVYSLGSETNGEGYNEPVYHVDGVVSDILDASDANGENFLMTFITEGNHTKDDVEQLEGEAYWQYQLNNYIRVQTKGAADANNELTVLFDKEIIYYQMQGNQQDDVAALPLMLNGKPTICFPYYEKVFYKPFYSADEDLFAEDNNNLVIEIWQQSEAGKTFELVQTTKIPVVKASAEDVTWSYYGVGSFGFRNDIEWSDGAASFVVTRSDYIASSDEERKAYLRYNSDGSVRKMLFENAQSLAFMSDLPGFDPQVLFIDYDGLDYWLHFMNMRTLEMDLEMNYGLQADPSDDPDYIIANIDRVLTPDGKSYNYVAEMRMPEYDDINDLTYMRVVWLTKDGKIDHFDKVNMGNNINYARLFLGQDALKPDYFHSDANREYMILIKRGAPGAQPREELLIGQAVSDEYPEGRDLLLLTPCDKGVLNSITPFSSKDGNYLQIIYSKENTQKETADLTIDYYDLPLDVDRSSGIDKVEADDAIDGISFNGSIVSAPGASIEIINLQGMAVANGSESLDLSGMAKGVYIIRANGKAAKIAIK